jgi:hypothetical protein
VTYTPIPAGTQDWDVPLNAALTDQDARITANASDIDTNLDNLVFNVKNHGAVGDGVTNDQPAIQALINSLEGSTSHGTIYFPRGTYKLNSALFPTRALRYTGDQGATLLTTASDIFNFNNQYMHPGYNGQVGVVEIDHLTLDATGGHVFTNANINQGSFHDLNLIQRSSNKSIWNSSGTLLVIDFRDIISTVYGATRSVPAWSVSGNNNADVANLTWRSCLFQNPDFDATQYQVLLQATQGGTGIWYHEQCAFIDCYFENPYGGAIKCLSGEGTLFQNCRTYDTFTNTVGNSLFYLGQAVNSTWPTTNTSFIGCGRDLQGPNGTTTWDIQLEAATLQTTIMNYSVRDIPPGVFNGQGFFNLGGASSVTLINNRHQALSNATNLNGVSVQPDQINFGSSTSGSQVAVKTASITDGVFSSRVTSDTINRYTVMGDGKLTWGNGSGAADTNLYRNSTSLLKTDSAMGVTGQLFADGGVASPNSKQINVGSSISAASFAVLRNAATGLAYAAQVNGDTQDRLVVNGNGDLLWGPGNATGDFMLARTPAANTGKVTQIGRLYDLQGGAGPSVQGFTAWSYDTETATASGAAANVSGTVYLHKIFLPANALITNIHIGVQTLGATLTAGQNLLGIYDSTGTRKGQTADQSAVWTSTGFKTAALTASYTTTAAGFHYIAVLAVGTTPPAFNQVGTAPSALFNGNTSGATLRHATNGTGQTSLAASLTLSSNTSSAFNVWCAVS